MAFEVSSVLKLVALVFKDWSNINFGPGSFVLTGLVEAAVVPYLGFSIQDLSLDEKAEFLLVAQGYAFHFVLIFKQMITCILYLC